MSPTMAVAWCNYPVWANYVGFKCCHIGMDDAIHIKYIALSMCLNQVTWLWACDIWGGKWYPLSCKQLLILLWGDVHKSGMPFIKGYPLMHKQLACEHVTDIWHCNQPSSVVAALSGLSPVRMLWITYLLCCVCYEVRESTFACTYVQNTAMRVCPSYLCSMYIVTHTLFPLLSSAVCILAKSHFLWSLILTCWSRYW